MSSEVCPYALEAISYLEDNDLSEIRVLDGWILFAKDGTRPVYIWLGGNLVPFSLLTRAAYIDARIDIITLDKGGHIQWQFNVTP